jgi:hypothetical protein
VFVGVALGECIASAVRIDRGFLEIFIDRTTLVVGRVISIAEDTLERSLRGLVEWPPAHFTHLGLRWQKFSVCPYRRKLAHCAISRECLGGSNLILDCCKNSTLKMSLLFGAGKRSMKNMESGCFVG